MPPRAQYANIARISDHMDYGKVSMANAEEENACLEDGFDAACGDSRPLTGGVGRHGLVLWKGDVWCVAIGGHAGEAAVTRAGHEQGVLAGGHRHRRPHVQRLPFLYTGDVGRCGLVPFKWGCLARR